MFDAKSAQPYAFTDRSCTVSSARFKKLEKHCKPEWESYWQALDARNQQLYSCRAEEKAFNKCVFEKLVGIFDWSAELSVEWAMSSITNLQCVSRDSKKRFLTHQRTKCRST
jgi:hypothetical protein